ncbi:hypothetical protein Tco_1506798 [Tanacetum coccineum]
MDITRAEQIALDDALVAPANRLKIGKSNFRLSSYLKSKEATLQVVYDVLKLTPFYKAFQVIADVPEIYMQEFWATATVYHHSIRFKMNNKKHIVNLEYFREMLQICPKLPNQQFKELPFEEAILTFLRDLGHSGEIKMITDVNVNKLHQPWRSFTGMYHKKNVNYAYLLWEDFVYQVENKNVKKSNEMYYPRFTKVIDNFFMTKDQSILRRNSVNWHYARDDYMFTTIKVVSRHEDTQLYGAILPNELTNEDIRNSESFKEYYAIASRAEPPNTKARVKKKQVGSYMSKTPPTKGKRLKTFVKAAKTTKKKQPAKTSKAKGVDEGTGSIPGVPDEPTYESDDEQISWKSSEEDDDDEVNNDENDDDDGNNDDDDDDDADNQDAKNQDDDDEQTDSDNNDPKFSTHDEEDSFDPSIQTRCDKEIKGANVEGEDMNEEATNKEDEGNELYKDMNVNLEGRDTKMTNAPLPNRLREEAQAENENFINTLDDNIKKIIKEQVKKQVKAQVTKILPKIKKTVNEQLEVEVLTRSSNESKTSYKNLYKALVDAYKSDKLILNTYGDTVPFKRRRDDEDKDEKPSVRSNRESKRRRARKEPESTSAPKEKTSKTTGKSTAGSKSHHKPVQPWLSSLAQTEDPRDSFNELMDTSLDFSAFVMNRLKVDTLTLVLLAGPTFELMKGSCKSLVELEYLFEEVYKATTDQLDWNNPEDQGCRLWAHQMDLKIWSPTECGVKYRESARDINVRRDDDKLYKFKEGDFNRLRIQDIKDMLLLLVQGKLTNLIVEERLAFNVSLRIFTRSVVIQRRVEDLQLGVESYQKKLNLTKPDTYRPDLKRKEAYTAYSNPIGFIYQNKDKKNILIRLDELHKFSFGTLNDVWTALNDRLKGIRMQYLPQTIWRQSDKDKAGAMIQSIDKQLKTMRIIRSLDKFIGGRPYEGDFWLLQRTI